MPPADGTERFSYDKKRGEVHVEQSQQAQLFLRVSQGRKTIGIQQFVRLPDTHSTADSKQDHSVPSHGI